MLFKRRFPWFVKDSYLWQLRQKGSHRNRNLRRCKQFCSLNSTFSSQKCKMNGAKFLSKNNLGFVSNSDIVYKCWLFLYTITLFLDKRGIHINCNCRKMRYPTFVREVNRAAVKMLVGGPSKGSWISECVFIFVPS